MRPNRRVRPRGASLLEAVAALFLLSLVLIFLLNLLPSARLTDLRAENRLQAGTLAQSALARAQAGSFDALVVGQKTDLGDVTCGTTVFDQQEQVAAVSGSGADRLRDVTVTVRWREKTGPQKLVREVYVTNVPR